MARRHLLQVELQAARQHRDRDLLRVRRRKDELHVRRRLLKRLEHRIERVMSQHVHFVDHIDLEARIDRRIDRALEQRRHFVDTAVAGRVHFDIVDEAPVVDLSTRVAHTAWRGRDAGLAIERLGQNPRQRGLANTARAGEQISMMEPLRLQRMGERAHHVLLADERREIPGPPLACENLIGHQEIVSATLAPTASQRPAAHRTQRNESHAHRVDTGNDRQGKKIGRPEDEVTSPTLGTGGKQLWLLRSRPDQVDRATMRGGPAAPQRIRATGRVFEDRAYRGAITRPYPGALRGNAIMSEQIKHITDASFEQDVLKADKPVLVDFWAQWCGPCKMIAPLLDEVARDYGERLQIAKIDVDQNPTTPAKFSVRGIPTLILFKNGVVAQTKVGALSKAQITALIDSHI
ncbi:hypothetical protein DFQ28_002345 [Apophysomyces sp. BC1034]|nr:hypothetical protein DFQ28_002345 [Apophysomyces sp. BC1034]